MNDFEFEFVDSAKSQCLMVEVLYKKQRVFQINRKNGDQHLEVELLTDFYLLEEPVKLAFPLEDFEVAHRKAAEILKNRYSNRN